MSWWSSEEGRDISEEMSYLLCCCLVLCTAITDYLVVETIAGRSLFLFLFPLKAQEIHILL